MADYKELIRKAIQALPENNGAARRAVYEKARAALVGQLRGLNPPLAARDITQHRLQLEDCIRQVEQEASEAAIAGLKQTEELPPPSRPQLAPPRSTPPASRATPTLATGASPRPSSSLATSGARTGATVARPASTPAAAPTPVRPAASGAQPAAVARPGASVRPATASPALVSRTLPAPAKFATSSSAPAARAAIGARTAARPAVMQPEPEVDYDEMEGAQLEAETPTIEEIIAAAQNDDAPLDEAPEAEEQAPEPVKPEVRPLMRRATPVAPRPEARGGNAPTPAADRIRVESRPMPAIVARADAAKARPGVRAFDNGQRPNGGDVSVSSPNAQQSAAALRPQMKPRPSPQPGLRGQGSSAMSSVREVEVESPNEGDPQIAIERAIATLEREARNDTEALGAAEVEAPIARGANAAQAAARRRGVAEADARVDDERDDQAYGSAPAEKERGGGSAVTVFLMVFLVLLIVAGGAGYWGWREGFIDLDAMFGNTRPSTEQAITTRSVTTVPQMATAAPNQTDTPTNTESVPDTAAQSNQPLNAPSTPAQSTTGNSGTAVATATPPATTPSEPSAQTGSEPKNEARLGASSTDQTPAAPSTANGATQPVPTAPAVAGGSQSLLLEASQDGTVGAVPFSGTVDWTRGTDEMGQPTLVGKASIPARNLGVSVLIRRNADPTLPASHLMEINFSVTDSFIGGAISGLPGVLLKNEELVQGTPLVGASARVVGNSFLFALSSSTADEQTNKDLLTSRKWMDLAIIYATGKKAIITLEKDDKAEQLFNDVFTAWAKTPTTPSPASASTR